VFKFVGEVKAPSLQSNETAIRVNCKVKFGPRPCEVAEIARSLEFGASKVARNFSGWKFSILAFRSTFVAEAKAEKEKNREVERH